MKAKNVPSLPVSACNSAGIDEESYWESHVDEWSSSGLSQRDYCRRHNLVYKKFCEWKKKLLGSCSAGSSVKLVEMKSDVVSSTARPPFTPGVFSSSPFVDRSFNSSEIRFWSGEFCIEVGEDFSSETLSQLLGTLKDFSDSFSQRG